MYSIGEFSKRTRISIQTLRLYDRHGLLKPGHVDAQTGYRHYQPTQILIAEQIRFLRNCDVPLKTIASLLRLQALGADDDILEILQEHETALMDRLSSIQRMQRWMRTLRTKTKDGNPSGARNVHEKDGAIEVIEVGSRTVLASKKFGEYEDVFPLIEELTDFALSQKLRVDGSPMLLWGEAFVAGQSSPGAAAKIEVAIPVSGRFASTAEMLRRRLPGGKMARLTFFGDRAQTGRHYERLSAWAFENRCTIAGIFREIYHNLPGAVAPSDSITEIQVPIRLPEE